MRQRVGKPRLVVCCCLLFAAVISVGERPRAAVNSTAPQFETRCGWFDNPTPANTWLFDREGRWIIGEQGGYQIEDDWDRPDFKKGQWAATNGHYGYGCACLQLRVNGKTGEVLEIRRARARPLAACRRDRALSKWKHLFK